MADFSTIGILGGMGPEATNQLCALLTALTPVARDQDHIPVITYNNSSIPDRVRAVRGEANAESPVPEMIRTARVLEEAGARLLLMPCNLAHFYYDDIQAAIRVPLLNMIEETVNFVVENYPHCRRVGIVASTPTLECGIYERAFLKRGRILLRPDDTDQQTKVMRAIYAEDGLKCGYKQKPRALLMEVAERLAAEGAEIIIAGCTEASLVMKQEESQFPIIDPMEIIARVAIERARAGTGAGAPPGEALASSESGAPAQAR
ncbi:MAG TPA: amino acid racemase [Pyrinomonadaceae bacterium]|nr:amino acid racemase [Pyrinomonadaceae bacterium]